MEILEDTREKLKSAVDLVIELEGIDFPHRDAGEALGILKQELERCLGELEDLDADTADPLVRSYCARATLTIVYALEAQGFIVNSTSIRNAFEVHQCLLNVAKKLIDNDARLLLSFEWNYVPFTYPLTVPLLPNFVVIGLPASEANNALIVPAAGHELGHSVWQHYRVRDKFDRVLQDTIINLIKEQFWDDFQKIFESFLHSPTDLDNLLGKQIWKDAHNWALAQTEELFCDIIGLVIFGTSYLHTFSYLLAPNLGKTRSNTYPSLKARSEFLKSAAERMDIPVPSGFVNRFDPQEEPSTLDRFASLLLRLADMSVQSLFDNIFKAAFELCQSRGFPPPKEEEWSRTIEAFRAHVPAEHAGTLANIINAGWAACHDPSVMDTFASGNRRNLATLNELLLKSIEVLEIENLLKEGSIDTQRA